MKTFRNKYIGYLLVLLIPVITQGLGVWIFNGWCRLPVTVERQEFLNEHRGIFEPDSGDLLSTTFKDEMRCTRPDEEIAYSLE